MTTLTMLLLALSLAGIPAETRTLSVSAFTDADGAHPYRGLMASGQYTRQGAAACGPSYAFGTLFVVAGKPYICLDRGPAISDGHLDLWHADRETALLWGRQELAVVVVRP